MRFFFNSSSLCYCLLIYNLFILYYSLLLCLDGIQKLGSFYGSNTTCRTIVVPYVDDYVVTLLNNFYSILNYYSKLALNAIPMLYCMF